MATHSMECIGPSRSGIWTSSDAHTVPSRPPHKMMLSVNVKEPMHVAPLSTGKTIVVTQWLPWQLSTQLSTQTSTQEDERFDLVARNEASSLYAGILGLRDTSSQCVFVGALEPPSVDAQILGRLHTEYAARPVLLDAETISGHAEYCQQILHPLLHYVLPDNVARSPSRERQHWHDYVAFNVRISEAIVAAYAPGDHIWIHDYPLFLVPAMVLKQLPAANIGFYLHVSFPSSEIFRCLPQRSQILEGVLGASLVGFQNYSYARHFISSCTRVLGLESTPTGIDCNGRQVSVGIFPSGVQVDRILARCSAESVRERMCALREMFGSRKLIVGRDRASQSKGILHKLEGFEKFLQMFPEWIGRVILVQITEPDVEMDRRTERRIWEAVSRVNGHYGSLQSLPIHTLNQEIELHHYLALLSVADLGLVTTEREAMDETAHDFVLCQAGRHAPLIISEFIGNAAAFNTALIVNPWDASGIAQAIHDGLGMSESDKRWRHRQLYKKISLSSTVQWARSFVAELSLVGRLSDQPFPTPGLDQELMGQAYRRATGRLIMLDYDGTLVAIQKTPSAAAPSPALLTMLQKLTQDPKNLVFIISGRDLTVLDAWLGSISGLGLSAEHGCFIKFPPGLGLGESGRWINMTEDIDLDWKNQVLPIFEYYTERTPGAFIEHKRASLTWHYRQADPQFGSWQAKECHNHLEDSILSKLPVEVLVGKKNLEVRPILINKGEVVRRLLAMRTESDFILCAGDDRTDEDMFRTLRTAFPSPTSSPEPTPGPALFSIAIGPSTKPTSARYCIPSPSELINALEQLADVYA